MDIDFTLTPAATAGVWEVRTFTGSVYRIAIDPDRPLEVIRYPQDGTLQHDGTPLPGVEDFAFRVGRPGIIQWWREPHERDEPGSAGLYVGTTRRTSTVTSIARLETGDEP